MTHHSPVSHPSVISYCRSVDSVYDYVYNQSHVLLSIFCMKKESK